MAEKTRQARVFGEADNDVEISNPPATAQVMLGAALREGDDAYPVPPASKVRVAGEERCDFSFRGGPQPSEVGPVEALVRARWITVSAFTMRMSKPTLPGARSSAPLSHRPAGIVTFRRAGDSSCRLRRAAHGGLLLLPVDSKCCGLVDWVQLEGDQVGRQLEAGEGGHGVTQRFVGLMSDDESFHRLAQLGEVGADVTDVARYLADDLVRGPPALQLHDNEGVRQMVGAQEVRATNRCHQLVSRLASRAGPDLQRASPVDRLPVAYQELLQVSLEDKLPCAVHSGPGGRAVSR
jgi:hypothetical protein